MHLPCCIAVLDLKLQARRIIIHIRVRIRRPVTEQIDRVFLNNEVRIIRCGRLPSVAGFSGIEEREILSSVRHNNSKISPEIISILGDSIEIICAGMTGIIRSGVPTGIGIIAGEARRRVRLKVTIRHQVLLRMED